MARRRDALPPEDLDAAGTVLAEGTIPGRPVAWKAPTIGRHGGCVPGRDYKRYKAWQEAVRLVAASQRPRRRSWPYRGPVHLRLRFVLRPVGPSPDTSNLTKAFEDALQGVLFANDRQVVSLSAERALSGTEPEGATYAVIAL